MRDLLQEWWQVLRLYLVVMTTHVKNYLKIVISSFENAIPKLVFAKFFMNVLRSKLKHGCLIAIVMPSFKIIFCCYVKNDLKIVISSFVKPFWGCYSQILLQDSYDRYLTWVPFHKSNEGFLVGFLWLMCPCLKNDRKIIVRSFWITTHGPYSQNFLQTSLGQYFGWGALLTTCRGLFKVILFS